MSIESREEPAESQKREKVKGERGERKKRKRRREKGRGKGSWFGRRGRLSCYDGMG